MRWTRPILVLIALLGLLGCASGGRTRPPLPMADVDLPRFMGTWHVIAHIPYFFENGKVATRDVYRLRDDGRIDNDFVFKKALDQPDRRWQGVSEVVPGSAGSRWRVQFIWPFSSEVVIVHVDDDYAGAALATPNRKLAWIFGRSPQMTAERRTRLVTQLAAAGVDVSRLRDVPQRPQGE